MHIDSLSTYRSFESDLWNKRFIPQPKDLLARVSNAMTDEARRSVMRELSNEVLYEPRMSQIFRDENDNPRMAMYGRDFESKSSNSLSRSNSDAPQQERKSQELDKSQELENPIEIKLVHTKSQKP